MRALGKTWSLKFELIRQGEAGELLAGAAGAEERSSHSSESPVTGEPKSGGYGRRREKRQGPLYSKQHLSTPKSPGCLSPVVLLEEGLQVTARSQQQCLSGKPL